MTDEPVDILPLELLRARFALLAPDYAATPPYPHVVLDDVLPADVFERAVAEFPPVDDPGWDGYLHVNETKFANRQRETWGPTLRAVADALCSEEFAEMLGELTSFDGLIPDPSMDGGGLHQTLRGGHLNVHTDFTTHHRHRRWRRRVNILLYLNRTWSPDWGGALELWDRDVRTAVRTVQPIGNRMLIFTTSGDAFHGHPDRLQCPDGMARRSLALYYFTDEDRPLRRPTRYRPRPDDGLKRVAIWADRHALGAYDVVKTRLGLSDRTASRLLRLTHRVTGPFRRSGR